MQHEVNFYNTDTTNYYTEMVGDTLYVQFEMVRYERGDIATMYNVYFYNDAAIMKPESKFEIESLLTMMEENESYKIRIHGHTNGSGAGKIISRKEGIDDFFSMSKSNIIEGYGSAKQLSKERGEAIKAYLVSKGIAPERMEVKAWGGKRMIHSKDGVRARKNVRVEIEIIED